MAAPLSTQGSHRHAYVVLQDDKPASNGAPAKPPAPRQPQLRVVPPPKGKEPKQDSYLGDMDLPSSSEESEGEERYTPLYAAEDKDRELSSMVRGACPALPAPAPFGWYFKCPPWLA